MEAFEEVMYVFPKKLMLVFMASVEGKNPRHVTIKP
jgi:hypothetical protein